MSSDIPKSHFLQIQCLNRVPVIWLVYCLWPMAPGPQGPLMPAYKVPGGSPVFFFWNTLYYCLFTCIILIIQLRLGLSTSSFILCKPQTNTIHTVTLIGRGRIPFTLEDMTKMASTVAAGNFRALHTKGAVHMSLYSTGNRVKIGRPATAGLELVIGLVQRCVAAGAVINTRGRGVGVIFTSSRALCPLLAEDPELFYMFK